MLLPRLNERRAQLASNLAAVLLVIPMFLFGAALLDRRIAFWGTLLFHALPETDPDVLARYRQALSEWKIVGAVILNRRAGEGLRETVEGVTAESLVERIRQFGHRGVEYVGTLDRGVDAAAIEVDQGHDLEQRP